MVLVICIAAGEWADKRGGEGAEVVGHDERQALAVKAQRRHQVLRAKVNAHHGVDWRQWLRLFLFLLRCHVFFLPSSSPEVYLFSPLLTSRSLFPNCLLFSVLSVLLCMAWWWCQLLWKLCKACSFLSCSAGLSEMRMRKLLRMASSTQKYMGHSDSMKYRHQRKKWAAHGRSPHTVES